jgi:hypothetical protein
LTSAIGCACLLAAQLWQPPFARELNICGVIALTLAMVLYLRQAVQR